MTRTRLLAAALLIAMPASLPAATISDAVMQSQSFSVASYTDGSSATASGNSNGVDWTMTGGGIYAPFTGNNTYTLSVGSYNFFALHVSGDWTINFASPVTSVLFLAQNDNTGNSGIDLNMAASASESFALTGTSYRVGPTAGYVLYEFAAPVTSVSNAYIANNNLSPYDGHDLSFFANPVPATVPLPAGALLLVSGLGGLVALRRRKS